MKLILLIIVIIALTQTMAQAQPADASIKAAAASNNAFAVDLYQKLQSAKGNLFFSPYSIDTALAMAYAGARGQTAQQMAQAMHFALPQDKLNDAFGAMIQDLNQRGRVGQMQLYQFVVANALWGQKGYPFNKDYQDLLKRAYDASLNEVDFKQTEEARKQINAWVEKQTNEKIKDLIPPRAINPLTRLVLTNAIYFKSNWADQFKKNATKDEPFHVSADQTVNVPMMHQQHRFGYVENEQMQVLELPYTGYGLSMLVLLPKKVDGIADLERNLTAENLGKWESSLRRRPVIVSMPKFKIEAQLGLADTLKSMGMTDAFSPDKADFSGIATVEKLCISDVIHKAYVDVNEEGTEAAAATAVMMVGAAMPKPEEPVTFTAEHPFLFVIWHRPSQAVLFMGRLVEPSK